MVRHSSPHHTADAAAGSDAGATVASDAADGARAKVHKARRRAAVRAEKAASKSAATAYAQQRKTAKAESKHRRAESKANRKASKAARKASKAAVKASEAAADAASTRPARIFDKVTDPKLAKRAVALGKIVAPAVAPAMLKAATGARGFLDRQRANRLGVPVEKVAIYRGPTGPYGARIDGLTDSVRDLAVRKGADLQVTRFVDVASARLKDLTATVQAAASMPRPHRGEVLRAVGRQLDELEADVVSHLLGSGAAENR